MKLELSYPCVPYRVNQRFGECAPNICHKYKELGLLGHNGMDLYAPDGTVVRAAHNGIVTFSGEDGSGGLGVVIRTNKKFDYKDGEAYYKTIYWHLKKGCIYVKAGQTVRTGDIIALADNTGLSTGSHLHFGLKPVYQGEQDWEWWNAEQDNGYKGAIDPEPFFTGRYAIASSSAGISSKIDAAATVLESWRDSDSAVVRSFAALLRGLIQ